MIVSAGYTETYEWAKAIGIGTNCSIKLSELIIKHKPKRLIFVGSMGLYKKELELFSIYEFNSAANIELAYLSDDAYTPMIQDLNTCLNSSNYICKNSNLAEKFSQKYSFIGENMECFSFFNTAKYFKINAKAILVATNYCDEKAHETYLKNSAKANEILENYLENKGYL